MMVILVTCIVAPAAASRYAARLPRPAPDRDLGEVVVVPMANPATAPRLMRVASAFARADGGIVVPLMVVPSETDQEGLQRARDLDDEVMQVAQSAGAEARSVLRIDASADAGIAHTVVEHQGSLLVMGWKGGTIRRGALFGGIIDGVLSRTAVPTLLVHEGDWDVRRVLLVIDETVTTAAGAPALGLAIEAARLLSREAGVKVEVVTNQEDRAVDARIAEQLEVPVQHDARRRSIVVKDLARSTDLVVIPTIGDEPNLTSVAARIVRATPEGASLFVAVDNSPVASEEAPARAGDGELPAGEPGGTATSTEPVTEPER
jgi:nucleotide-binding universal stress UspA family protein